MKDIAPSAAETQCGLFERLALQQLVKPGEEAPAGTLRPRLPYPFGRGESTATDEEDANNPTCFEPGAPAKLNLPQFPVAAPRDRGGTAPGQISELRKPSAALPRLDSPVPAPAPAPEKPEPAETLRPLALSATSTGRPALPHASLPLWPPPLIERRVVVEPPRRAPRGDPQSARITASKAKQQPTTTPGLRPVTLPPAPSVRPKLPPHEKALGPSKAALEPVVEIHIGRIDVRAQVTAPAKNPPPPAPPIDDRLAGYLARRNRGARS